MRRLQAHAIAAALVVVALIGLVLQPASPSARAKLRHPAAPRLGKTLFAPVFPSGTQLVTNDYAYFNRSNPRAVQSVDWFVTSGSLFARNGAGWTGVPDSATPDAGSTNGTGSATLRLITRRKDFSNVGVAFDLLNQGNVVTPRNHAHSWDGVHLFLRYASPESLYVVSVNRRDKIIVVKKKRPGGASNGGTYSTLGAPVSYTARPGRWQRVLVTIRTTLNHTVTITATMDGRLRLTVIDRGAGGPAITEPGAVGLRGDNTEFEFAHFRIQAYG